MAQDPEPKRVQPAEFIIPVVAILFTLYYVWSVREGPFEAKFSSYFVGTALLLTCSIFVVTRLLSVWRHGVAEVEPESKAPWRLHATRVALAILTIGYVLVIEGGLGFTLSNFIFLTCAINLLTGLSHPLRATGVAAALALAGYLLFIVAFETRFPEGPVERALATLFS